MDRCLRAFLVLAALPALFLAAPAAANPIVALFDNLPECDPLPTFDLTEELGDPAVGMGPGFPGDEAISSSVVETNLVTCDIPFNHGGDDWLVSITNLTEGAFVDLYFVANTDGYMSNFDGFVTDLTGGGFIAPAGFAFKIDDVGVNRPLISESITPDLIFEPGETWQFIVIDFTTGAAPAPFLSLGISSGTVPSAASIMANVYIPEPGTGLLMGLGLAGLAAHRRQQGC